MRDDTKGLSEKIGRFLTSFGEIEFQIYELLRILPSTKYSKFALKQTGFETRVRFCQLLIMAVNEYASEELIEKLETSISISKYRNKLVHNPIRVDIYQDPDSGDITALRPEWINAKNEDAMPHIYSELDVQINACNEIGTFLLKITQANKRHGKNRI